MRVVSLLASGTELVCALGAGDTLVGRSHECDTPDWVKRLPVCSAPAFDISGSSRDIDERVRRRMRAGEPLYLVDDALIERLAPDVLITQSHCEVCAVSPADIGRGTPGTLVRRQVADLRASSLEDILGNAREVARVLHRSAEGEALVSQLRARIRAVSERTRELKPVSAVGLEWIEPLFNMGNWGPELVALAGGRALLGAAGEFSTSIEWQRVREADPEVLLIAPCGFPLERTLREMHLLDAQPGWGNLRAVSCGRVIVADGNRYFNRSGPSVVRSIEMLAEILHPSEFAPLHEGTCWRKYSFRAQMTHSSSRQT